MKVGDFVRTEHGTTGIIVEWRVPVGVCGASWYVWMTGTEEVHYFQTEQLEVISESR